MSGSTKEWLIVLAFFLGFFVFTFAETAWVNKRVGAGFAKSLLFAFASNIFTVTVGFFFSFVIIAVILALAWDGSLEQTTKTEASLIAALAAAAAAPLIVSLIIKLLLIRVLKFSGLGKPFAYAFAASCIFLFVTLAPALATGYFL